MPYGPGQQQQQHIDCATMVPTTRNLPQLHHSSGKNSKPPPSYYPGYYIAAQLEATSAATHSVDDLKQPSRFPWQLTMADDDNAEGNRGKEAAAGTCSRNGGGEGDYQDGGDKDWLRLGLGAMASTTSSSASGDNDSARAALMELDLFAGDGKQSARMMNRPPLFPLSIRSYHYQYGHAASGSMARAPPFLLFARPFRRCSADLFIRAVSPPPPRTEAAGLWLTLQAAPNQ